MADKPLEIAVQGMHEIKRYLRQLAERGKNLRPIMRTIAGDMHDAVEENFEQQGRPAWAELKPAYEKYKNKKKKTSDGKILEFTGALRNSITTQSDASSATVGTNKIYAAIHQFGGEITIPAKRETTIYMTYKYTPERKIEIEARPFLKLTDDDIKDIERRVIEYLTRK